ncbi:hypothetical protein Aperf_G00000008186 [Anoplocephala perfoliata]
MFVSPDYSVSIPDYDIKDHDFVAYFVQVKALSDKALEISNGIKSWCVSRRFSEFHRLREMLEEELPTCLIPPLPSKQDGASKGWYKFASAIGARSVGGHVSLDSIPGAVVGRRFDADLIDSRRQGLETFLNRCLSHPRISRSVILRSFLRECEDWTASLLDLDKLSSSCEVAEKRAITSETTESVPKVSTAVLTQKSHEMMDSVKHCINLWKQISKRQANLNQINKQAADALHRWCPHEAQNLPIADSIQTLAHSLDSYHGLLGLTREEEGDVEERLRGHVRYSAALSDLCARDASIRRDIVADRTLLLQLQNDVQALQNGTRPDLIPSVVGPVNSMTNNMISGLKSFFLNNETSRSGLEEVSAKEIEKAMERIIKKIQDASNRLAGLEEIRSDFEKSVAEEYAFFEKEQSTDLAATMRAYAALQLQRAERCKRLWERAHAAMLNAVTAPQGGSPCPNADIEASNAPSSSTIAEQSRPATLPEM